MLASYRRGSPVNESESSKRDVRAGAASEERQKERKRMGVHGCRPARRWRRVWQQRSWGGGGGGRKGKDSKQNTARLTSGGGCCASRGMAAWQCGTSAGGKARHEVSTNRWHHGIATKAAVGGGQRRCTTLSAAGVAICAGRDPALHQSNTVPSALASALSCSPASRPMARASSSAATEGEGGGGRSKS